MKNIKKISHIQADIANKRTSRDALLDEYEKIEESEKATATKNKLIEDFDSVQLQVEAKRAELDDALKLFRFVTDADEEVDWCKEKLVVVEHEAPVILPSREQLASSISILNMNLKHGQERSTRFLQPPMSLVITPPKRHMNYVMRIRHFKKH